MKLLFKQGVGSLVTDTSNGDLTDLQYDLNIQEVIDHIRFATI